jgi:hypothetical protein
MISSSAHVFSVLQRVSAPMQYVSGAEGRPKRHGTSAFSRAGQSSAAFCLFSNTVPQLWSGQSSMLTWAASGGNSLNM